MALQRIKIEVTKEKCYLCGSCVAVCPKESIVLENDEWIFFQDRCISCKFCIAACPVGALSAKPLEEE
ncbi:ferredoxin [Palaeococcus pacificus DY20341]|uniref:Ferredoxin n=1 Tax=Palaeococcus pacificus DY20341 TaxID=1343739 RepID=A0A075LZ42_9EURY|nr:4Fe-4S dicluster domain-containing protein [Palaeococcus pacificus]AIF69833.1 ferredoxin [Palaeococcus pacificus DY20341]